MGVADIIRNVIKKSVKFPKTKGKGANLNKTLQELKNIDESLADYHERLNELELKIVEAEEFSHLSADLFSLYTEKIKALEELVAKLSEFLAVSFQNDELKEYIPNNANLKEQTARIEETSTHCSYDYI